MALCPCPLLVVPLPVVLLLLLAVPSSAADGDSLEEPSQNEFIAKFEREEREYYESLGQKGQQEDKCNVHYNPENGKCAWWNDNDQKYERPALKYGITEKDFNCVSTFHSRIFGPSCGNPKFEMVKHCAKVKFFNNIPPQEGGITEHNENSLLLLIDGCLVCLKAEMDDSLRIDVKMRLSYRLSAGSFFTACDETTMETDEFSLTLDKQDVNKRAGVKPKSAMLSTESESNNTNARAKAGQEEEYYDNGDGKEDDDAEDKEASCPEDCVKKEEVEETLSEGQRHFGVFTVPVVLLQRKCLGLFTMDTPEDAFYNVTLTVEHNCEDVRAKSESPMHIPLADTLKLSRFKDNVAEVRGMYINLRANTVSQQQALIDKGYYRAIRNNKHKNQRNAVEFGNKKQSGDLKPMVVD